MRCDVLIRDARYVLPMVDGAGALEGHSVAVRDGRVAWVGPTADAPDAARVVDASDAIVLPGLVDCHTHAVWAGSRAGEFEARLAGADYSAILESGGGILSTVRATRAASDAELVDLCAARLSGMRRRGVTTVEVKSGYGLSAEHEPRLLRAATEAGRVAGVRVVPTFLGAHAVPAEWRPDRVGYVRDVIERQLPAVVGLAAAIDVYVDRGAFTVDEGRAILTAGRALGLGVRIHAEQVDFTGAAAMGAELGATSADHLERIDAAGIAAMARAGTVAVLLPGAMVWLRDTPPPVAALRAAGVPLAVATDLNPGTSPVDDLWAAATLATVTMRLTVTEALLGVTAHAGRALGRPDLGVLRPGAVGDVVVVEPRPGESTPASLVQHLGAPTVRALVVGGKVA